MQALQKGLLNITVVEAHITRDTTMIGNMSPYVTLTCGMTKLKSTVKSSAGAKPKWNETFQFDVESMSQEIFVRLWDSGLVSSDAVGFVKVKMSALCFNEGVDDWFTLYYDNSSAGKIHFVTKFVPEGGSEYDAELAKYKQQQEAVERELAQQKEAVKLMEQREADIQKQLAE